MVAVASPVIAMGPLTWMGAVLNPDIPEPRLNPDLEPRGPPEGGGVSLGAEGGGGGGADSGMGGSAGWAPPAAPSPPPWLS